MSTRNEFLRDIQRAEGNTPQVQERARELGYIEPPRANQPSMYNTIGGARGFEGSKYEVRNFVYPDDLHSNRTEYGGNFVIFYINVVHDPQLNNGDGNLDLNGNPVQTLSVPDEALLSRDRGQLNALGLDQEELVGSIAAQSAVTAIAAGGLNATTLKGAAGGAAINTVGAGAVAAYAPSATRQTKRLKSAIALHVPNQLQVRYSSQWSEEDTAAFAMTQNVSGNMVTALKNAVSSTGMSDENVSDSANSMGTAGANIFLSKGMGAGAVSVATGLAANPKKEQAFKGVDFRTFSFDYQFFPRSEQEAQNVLNIVKQFKYHMHPEMKDDRNFLYLYPSEFDIAYYHGGVENMNIHRHTSCVLTDLNINYTPNGVFTTYRNGMPTQINVAMTFKELAVLTKEKIRDGL